MPQDKRKPIRYRSFVTCDDPKGVIECGSIRKSKAISTQKRVQHQNPNKVTIEGDRKRPGNQTTVISTTSLAVIKEGKKEMSVQRITRELKASATFQLLEVSKGADKMNHVIKSLSKEKGQQDHDIAKDLLKGALDLQESLIMLGKLKKEASSIMSRSRRKHKDKLVEDGTFDGMLSGVSANKVGYVQGDEEQYLGWQRPKKSGHELKKVVRESLLRQCVITNPIFEEEFDHRNVDCSEMPSTSSSQSSSLLRSSNFAMSDCSTSSTASQRKAKKDSNLIFRLMGLESPPVSPRWYREGDNKLVNLSKTVYDINSPRARKPYFGHAQDLRIKQRTVEEILESLNFKGLLRSSPVNGVSGNCPSSEVFNFKDKWIDERPPIVIMKPSRHPSLDLDEPIMPRFRMGEVAKPTCSARSVEESISREGPGCDKAGGKSMKKVALASAKGSVNQDQKPKKKQAVPRKASEVEKLTPNIRKEEDRKDAKSREELLCSRDQEKLGSPRLIKQKDGRFTPKHPHLCSQLDVTSTLILDPRNQEMCAISGQWRKGKRLSVANFDSPECVLMQEVNKSCKEKDLDVVYREEIASTSGNDTVPAQVNNLTYDSFPEENWSRRSCKIHIKDYDIDNQSYASEVHGANKYKYDDSHSCYSEVTSVPTSERSLVSLPNEHHSPVCEVTLVTTHEDGVAVQTADTSPPILTETGMRPLKETDCAASTSCLTPRTKLKALLLSNPLFVSNLDELFDLQVHPELIPWVDHETVAADVRRARVLIDYANEVLQLKSSQLFSQSYLPHNWSCSPKPRNSISLDRLLDEICNGIKDLRSYPTSVRDDSFTSENLYLALSLDLSFKSGAWETGWKRMFSQREIEQVIGELDKAILGKMIEEVVSELLV